MDRFDLERAMLSSQMPALSKMLFLILCALIDSASRKILPQHQPSLNRMARAASLCRTSIRNHLYRLEAAGWITSFPPHPDAARREWARTYYILHIPGSPEFSAARSRQPAEMRREARRARAALAQQKARARHHQTAAQPANTTGPAFPPAGPVSPGRLGGAVQEEAAVLGRPVTAAAAGEIARQILTGRKVRAGAQEAYVREAVRRSPAKYLPAPAGPPRPPAAQPAPPDLAPAAAARARDLMAHRKKAP